MTTSTCPRSTVKLQPFSTCSEPNLLCRSLTSIIAIADPSKRPALARFESRAAESRDGEARVYSSYLVRFSRCAAQMDIG